MIELLQVTGEVFLIKELIRMAEMEMDRGEHVDCLITRRESAYIRDLFGASLAPMNLICIAVDGQRNRFGACRVKPGLNRAEDPTAE
jgi:hypothetical protein